METQYAIHNDVKFKALELIDVARLQRATKEQWFNQTLCEVNDSVVRLGVLKGEFHWHQHDDTDDFFLVLKGRITIRMREGDVTLGPGEMFVVPKGVQHCPVAAEEAHLLLIEPTGTPNTGDAATAAPRRVI